MAVKKLNPDSKADSTIKLDPNAEATGVKLLTPTEQVKEPKTDGGVVKEIIYPDMNSGIEENNIPSGNPGEIESPIVNNGGVQPSKPNAGTNISTPQLQNADLNFNQYGDDSSAANQNTAGGMYDKYEGEGVKTSNVNYNPNASLDTLNPNYQYGMDAQRANTNSAGYIARRNDEIASALYNAGMTSKDDVINFLAQQKGWNNSTEADRVNTVESIWKRLGSIQSTQEKDQIEEDINSIKDVTDLKTLVEDTSGKLYGKTTADEGNPNKGIDLIADANSIYAQMNQARTANVNALRSMKPVNAATSTYFGSNPYGDQALRDIQNLDPEWYAQYQQELKKLYTQDKVNNLTHGSAEEESRDYVDSIEETINNDIKTREDQNLDDDNIEGYEGVLETKLRSNQTASSAKEQMMNIKMDIEDLNSELDDLQNKAEKAFKGDVPDYIVQAYISNNKQRLQKKIQNLENKFNSLSDIYKTEVGNTQRELDYQLKRDQYNRDLTNDMFDRYYKEAQLGLDMVHRGTDANGNMVAFQYDPATNTMRQVTDGEAFDLYQNAVAKVSAKAKSLVGQSTGLQCTGFTNKLTQETAGVTMKNSNGGTATAEDKILYATNPNVSDYLPVVGDVAVAVGGPYDSYWGHTMYVDNVWTDANGETWFHYIATNDGTNKDDKTIAYEGTKSVTDFYNNHGVGFWNPFKQSQYNNRKSSSWDSSLYLDPMEPIVDSKYKNGNLAITTQTVLSRFWNSYNKLYTAREDGSLLDLLNSDTFSMFLKDFSFDIDESGRDKNGTGDDLVDTFMKQIRQAGAKYFNGNGYNAFLAMMGVLETKLRDESGAKINNGEWKQDFMEYVPESSDNPERRLWKINNLEKYLRAYAKRGLITADEYIPLFDIYELGSDGKIYDKRKGTSNTSASSGKKFSKRNERKYF